MLVFKLHKVIGQRSFQICTGIKILNCSDFNETYLKSFVLIYLFRKKEKFYIPQNDALMLTHDLLTHLFIYFMYNTQWI